MVLKIRESAYSFLVDIQDSDAHGVGADVVFGDLAAGFADEGSAEGGVDADGAAGGLCIGFGVFLKLIEVMVAADAFEAEAGIGFDEFIFGLFAGIEEFEGDAVTGQSDIIHFLQLGVEDAAVTNHSSAGIFDDNIVRTQGPDGDDGSVFGDVFFALFHDCFLFSFI